MRGLLRTNQKTIYNLYLYLILFSFSFLCGFGTIPYIYIHIYIYMLLLNTLLMDDTSLSKDYSRDYIRALLPYFNIHMSLEIRAI